MSSTGGDREDDIQDEDDDDMSQRPTRARRQGMHCWLSKRGSYFDDVMKRFFISYLFYNRCNKMMNDVLLCFFPDFVH